MNIQLAIEHPWNTRIKKEREHQSPRRPTFLCFSNQVRQNQKLFSPHVSFLPEKRTHSSQLKLLLFSLLFSSHPYHLLDQNKNNPLALGPLCLGAKQMAFSFFLAKQNTNQDPSKTETVCLALLQMKANPLFSFLNQLQPKN